MPESLRNYLSNRSKESGYGSVSEYVRDLIRADQRRHIAQANEQIERRMRYEEQMRGRGR